MMRTKEAQEKLARAIGNPDAWIQRERTSDGHYVYVGGVGAKMLSTGCFSPEQCFAMASLNFDLWTTRQRDSVIDKVPRYVDRIGAAPNP